MTRRKSLCERRYSSKSLDWLVGFIVFGCDFYIGGVDFRREKGDISKNVFFQLIGEIRHVFIVKIKRSTIDVRPFGEVFDRNLGQAFLGDEVEKGIPDKLFCADLSAVGFHFFRSLVNSMNECVEYRTYGCGLMIVRTANSIIINNVVINQRSVH